MRLLIVRHGDPDYANDTLTPAGRREAALLSKRLAMISNAHFYVSPLGRAQDTARPTLARTGQTAETLPWLREFHAPIPDPVTGEPRIPWDHLPADWTTISEYYDKDLWSVTEVMAGAKVGEEADRVAHGLDELLARHGYQRDGGIYRVTEANEDSIVLICHFGVECVMLGHLLGISPMVLWHGFVALPTSVTTLITEERRKGVAAFRVQAFGDTSHLAAAGISPSFSARFCERFDNPYERHD